MLPSPDEPAYWIISIAISLLGLIVSLLLAYWIIRLAITHGTLSYSRQLAEDRVPLRPHRV
jgi:hypothetical protein